MFTVSRSAGLYAGATWEGLVVDPDDAVRAELHGGPLSLQRLLVQGEVEPDARTRPFVEALRRGDQRD